VDGQSYHAGAQITSEHWENLQVGSSLPVRYLSSDPAHAYPSADPPHRESLWWMPYPFAAFMIVWGVWTLSMLWRIGRLLRGGCPARAVVTRCVEVRARGGKAYTVDYEFPLAEGGLCRGKGSGWQPFAEGSAICVLYDPDNPRRNAPYPLDAVRLAAG
jgi:hypothetical protein